MKGNIQQDGIISDANVLIDYAKSAARVLRLVNTHIKQLYVALPVAKEVDQLNIAEIEALGISVVIPSFDQLIEANHIRMMQPSISGQDAISFVLARDNNWACLTNDKALRTYCQTHKLTCIWGLEMMHHLVAAQKLTSQEALRIAKDIQSKNKHITTETVTRFKQLLGL